LITRILQLLLFWDENAPNSLAPDLVTNNRAHSCRTLGKEPTCTSGGYGEGGGLGGRTSFECHTKY